ncbi:MAG TPA: hypothetical protein VIZ43_00645 [Trebonia sp.]
MSAWFWLAAAMCGSVFALMVVSTGYILWIISRPEDTGTGRRSLSFVRAADARTANVTTFAATPPLLARLGINDDEHAR